MVSRRRLPFTLILQKNKNIHNSLTFFCNIFKYSTLLSDGSILNPHRTITFGVIPHLFELFLFKNNQTQPILLLKTY